MFFSVIFSSWNIAYIWYLIREGHLLQNSVDVVCNLLASSMPVDAPVRIFHFSPVNANHTVSILTNTVPLFLAACLTVSGHALRTRFHRQEVHVSRMIVLACFRLLQFELRLGLATAKHAGTARRRGDRWWRQRDNTRQRHSLFGIYSLRGVGVSGRTLLQATEESNGVPRQQQEGTMGELANPLIIGI